MSYLKLVVVLLWCGGMYWVPVEAQTFPTDEAGEFVYIRDGVLEALPKDELVARCLSVLDAQFGEAERSLIYWDESIGLLHGDLVVPLTEAKRRRHRKNELVFRYTLFVGAGKYRLSIRFRRLLWPKKKAYKSLYTNRESPYFGVNNEEWARWGSYGYEAVRLFAEDLHTGLNEYDEHTEN